MNPSKSQQPQQSSKQQSSQLPSGFVYIDQIDPTIISNLRYLTQQNFLGQKLIGYYVNRAILTQPAAIALKQANKQFSQSNYTIVIYDSYRPQKTVNRFIEWSGQQNNIIKKSQYYPYIDKSELFDKGYVAKKSGHSRGSTLDISIIHKSKQLKQIEQKLRQLENGKLIFVLDDNTQDMGTSFDFMNQASHPDSDLIEKKYINNRNYLINVMQKYGFKVLSTEWWHFTFINQPYKNQYFDFDVK